MFIIVHYYVDWTDLFAVAHGTLSSNHNFTSGILLDLLGGHAARTEDPTDKVELQQSYTMS